ncbi:putative 2OG-Fe(II) oxygenase, partial [Alteromonas sp. AMM-1]|uniref:putative 2OG-Fe(II) oxygenase n=1 Tax=Alteromonas sp. AMM-1 TaxID=3394233 RepID=UPI0039A6520E
FSGDDHPFRYFKQAIAAQPQNLPFWLAFIHLLTKCNDWHQAREQFEQLQVHHKTTTDILLLQSTIERECGNLAKALQCTEKAMSLQPKPHATALINEHSYNLLANGLYQQALQCAQLLIKREPKDQGWWNLYVTCLRKLDKSKAYNALCNYQQLVSITDWQADPDTINTLVEYLQNSHSGKRQPIGQSLQQGTQTLEELFDIPDKPVVNLKQHILSTIESHIASLARDANHPLLSRLPETHDYFFTGSWSVRLRQNGFHKPHFHPAGWLSGVIYLGVPDAVDEEGQGWIEFGRPNITGLHDEPEYVVKPKVGRLILFPSYMWHGTRAFTSDETRLTVAFDLIPASERQ